MCIQNKDVKINMSAKASVVYDEPIFVQGYRLTFVRLKSGEVIGVLIEGPRIPKPLYIPKLPGTKLTIKLPEHVRKVLEKESFSV
ncbi:hypothetical protein IOK49_02015 [Fervidicoccus fontis]|uniref:Uncharacterized protein n=2 Tax=Fervidicoccus fontis TaxID=683846 RepID=H9ZZE7_FERFK|nr:hypothetical protein [Fervidicoccus fontis]AFH42104.1 hypothetical protein FFONT_0112 [Fervidicoccus fontis Kam940]MBE9390859.1 hypothetical protein [Fervidicoccus fontis]